MVNLSVIKYCIFVNKKSMFCIGKTASEKIDFRLFLNGGIINDFNFFPFSYLISIFKNLVILLDK